MPNQPLFWVEKGPVMETELKNILRVGLTPEIEEKLISAALEAGSTKSALVRFWIVEKLKEIEKEAKS